MKSGDGELARPIRRFEDPPKRTPTPQELLKALNHPLRLRILRTLHEVGEARSPRELSQAFGVSLSNVSYHVRVLREKGVVALTDRRPVRGSSEHFYFSVLIGNNLAIRLLESATKGDWDAEL
jgi:DNA-binding transcriptional ArsR family regulator